MLLIFLTARLANGFKSTRSGCCCAYDNAGAAHDRFGEAVRLFRHGPDAGRNRRNDLGGLHHGDATEVLLVAIYRRFANASIEEPIALILALASIRLAGRDATIGGIGCFWLRSNRSRWSPRVPHPRLRPRRGAGRMLRASRSIRSAKSSLLQLMLGESAAGGGGPGSTIVIEPTCPSKITDWVTCRNS